MMIDYGEVYKAAYQFIGTRDGLKNPKNPYNLAWFIRDFTGILCGMAHEHNVSSNEIISFLTLATEHTIAPIQCDGRMHDVSALIDREILDHPMYKITERPLMYFKPGNTQVGPGEFFMCFYDKYSRYGVDNISGYDVLVDGVATEMKSYGSNFTTPELLDKYAASDKVERLLVVKPVSNAISPRDRSKYICCDTKDWRQHFTHVGKNGSLVLL
jgi:hypothetical protein